MPCWRLEDFGEPAEVSVTFVDNKEIQTLNREYRQKDAPTDVLSFPMGENGEYDLNEDTGAYTAGRCGDLDGKGCGAGRDVWPLPASREVGFLTVHSMLHLLGYDHESGGTGSCQSCAEKEETVLSRLGLSRERRSYVAGAAVREKAREL